MENTNEILNEAKRLNQEGALPYAGALRPEAAYHVATTLPGARIVDVRTKAEWDWVGQIPGALMIEWNQWPGGMRNPNFATALAEAAPDKQLPLLFLCRSGVRSHHAASLAKELGYENAFNVLEGFEGDKDTNGHRNRLNGWRFHGLPWIQA